MQPTPDQIATFRCLFLAHRQPYQAWMQSSHAPNTYRKNLLVCHMPVQISQPHAQPVQGGGGSIRRLAGASSHARAWLEAAPGGEERGT